MRVGGSLGWSPEWSGSGLDVVIVDGGSSTGDLRDADALTPQRVLELIEQGRRLGAVVASTGLVALGEVGVGNTTVAAALTALLLDLDADDCVGRGAGADTAIMHRKREVVAGALRRVRSGERTTGPGHPVRALTSLGGPEFALLVGTALGAVEAGAVVVLDGLATLVAALTAVLLEPAVAVHLVGGQRSREPAHAPVLTELGLEPLLDLRIRAGDGVGAAMAAGLLLPALTVRRTVARTG